MTQLELLPVDHRSMQQNRLRKHKDAVNPERIYAARWKKLMRQRLVSTGATYLEMILAPNCGLGFILGCESTIEELRDQMDRAHRRPSLKEAQAEQAYLRTTRRAVALRGLR